MGFEGIIGVLVGALSVGVFGFLIYYQFAKKKKEKACLGSCGGCTHYKTCEDHLYENKPESKKP